MLYLYLAHNRSYYFVRNMMFVAMAIGLLGYAFYPTAPPRFLPNWGFVDTVSQITNTSPHNNAIQNALVNPYAAVPSMHVACAAMLGWTLVSSCAIGSRAFAGHCGMLLTFVTLLTANHFVIDTVLGLATAGVAALVAYRLARVRPHVWAFQRQPARAAPQPVFVTHAPGFVGAQSGALSAQPAAFASQPAAFSSQAAGTVAQSATSAVSS